MQSSSKSSPKSCSCTMCFHGKRCRLGHFYMKKEERAFRHKMDTSLRKGEDEDVTPSLRGQRLG